MDISRQGYVATIGYNRKLVLRTGTRNYATDELLNSKNEYNANHLTRVVIDEDEYTKKKRQRMEEIAELEDKRKLEEFKKGKRQQMKRMRNEDDETIPDGWKGHTACKRLNRMPEEEEETLDVSGWWRIAEGMCTT